MIMRIISIITILFNIFLLSYAKKDCSTGAGNSVISLLHHQPTVVCKYLRKDKKKNDLFYPGKRRNLHGFDVPDSGTGKESTSLKRSHHVTIPAVNRWFLLGEVLAIVTAYFYPRLGSSGGLLRTDIYVSKIGVFLLFFLKGLSVSPTAFRDACTHYHVNILTQIFSSVFIPLFTWAIVGPFVTDTGFRDGLICLAALPCALNTAVSLAAAAGAKTSTVFFNGILGRLLGVVLTPAIVAIMMESGGTVEGVTWGSQESMNIGQLLLALRKIGVYVFLPMALSQFVRRIPNLLPEKLMKYSEQESIIDEVIMLALVQQSFSDTFLHGENINKSNLIYCICLMPLAYLTGNALFWWLTKRLLWRVDIRTRAAATICATQKSLSFGIPFIRAAFGHRSDLAEIVAPLLIFNAVQLFFGATTVVPILKHNIRRYEKKRGAAIAPVTSSSHDASAAALVFHQQQGGTHNYHHNVPTTATDVADGGELSFKNSDGEANGEEEEEEEESKATAVILMKFLRLLHKSVVKGRVRAALTAMCGLCVSLELAEDLIQDIPVLDRLVGRFKVQYAVLFLTLIHLINNLAELMENIDSQEDILQKDKIRGLIADSMTKYFTSEEEAARAYDYAAVEIFGKGAALNFMYSEQIDGVVSKYKGVVWDQTRKAWRVDPGSLGYEKDDMLI